MFKNRPRFLGGPSTYLGVVSEGQDIVKRLFS